MQITTTNTLDLKPHSVIYGPSKSGKTRLIPTLKAPLIMSCDDGLESIRQHQLPVVECNTWDKIAEFKNFVFSDSAEKKKYCEFVFDDISEMAALYLIKALAANKDGRKAYGQMADEMMAFFRSIRKVKTNVIHLIAKEEKVQNEKKEFLYSPMLPGQAMHGMVPYMFGQIYHMETWTDPSNGVIHEVLRCKRTVGIEAGDRTGNLGEIEFANLGAINDKVLS